MDRDTLYYHFCNLGLVLIGLLGIQAILGPFIFMLVTVGTIAGFFVSWQTRVSRFQYMDMFIGMLSLATIVIIFGKLYDTAISFENLLRIFSIALAWLTLFQSFGLKTGKSYAVLQFISVNLLITSVALALEEETFYIILLAVFLYLFIFTMRLNLVCERKRKGSLIIGDQKEIMSLWQQIKVGALMFFFVFIVSSFVYPLVPRFENLSLRWIPSTLLGIPEKIPLLKILKEAPRVIKDNKKVKEEQLIDDGTPKRETAGEHPRKDMSKRKMGEEPAERGQDESIQKEKIISKRFPAKKFNADIDIFKIESLAIRSDRDSVPFNEQCKLEAELKMNDGSVIMATQLVDWKITGTAEASMDNDGNFVPKEKGVVEISASYLGSFSNTVEVEIIESTGPVEQKSWLYYLIIIFLWLLILVLVYITTRIFIKQNRLNELAVKNPKEFVKEVYLALCHGLKLYGFRRFDYVAHREYFESLIRLVSAKPEPMRLMTEHVLEVRFSTHKISRQDSRRMLELFHEVKGVILERETRKEIWKRFLFRLFLMDVLMVRIKT